MIPRIRVGCAAGVRRAHVPAGSHRVDSNGLTCRDVVPNVVVPRVHGAIGLVGEARAARAGVCYRHVFASRPPVFQIAVIADESECFAGGEQYHTQGTAFRRRRHRDMPSAGNFHSCSRQRMRIGGQRNGVTCKQHGQPCRSTGSIKGSTEKLARLTCVVSTRIGLAAVNGGVFFLAFT